MQRKFNYTDRKKITRSAIRMTLLPRTDGPLAFDAKIDLDGLELPEHACVCVEAYHKALYMRFNFGKVGGYLCAGGPCVARHRRRCVRLCFA